MRGLIIVAAVGGIAVPVIPVFLFLLLFPLRPVFTRIFPTVVVVGASALLLVFTVIFVEIHELNSFCSYVCFDVREFMSARSENNYNIPFFRCSVKDTGWQKSHMTEIVRIVFRVSEPSCWRPERNQDCRGGIFLVQ